MGVGAVGCRVGRTVVVDTSWWHIRLGERLLMDRNVFGSVYCFLRAGVFFLSLARRSFHYDDGRLVGICLAGVFSRVLSGCFRAVGAPF